MDTREAQVLAKRFAEVYGRASIPTQEAVLTELLLEQYQKGASENVARTNEVLDRVGESILAETPRGGLLGHAIEMSLESGAKATRS